MQINIPSPNALPEAARQFVPLTRQHHIFAFYGSMGAGKTTFINALCREMGVTDPTGSPTFAIVNEYALPQPGQCVYHFDFYRIQSLAEVYDIGYEDYFYSNQLCLIEWPELIEPLLPPETISVHITANPDNTRTLDITL